jgi:hypothetical protein
MTADPSPMSGAPGGGRRYVVSAQRRVHILDGGHAGAGKRLRRGGFAG